MRFDGTLTQWNDERGFGFITPQPAGQALFVHVSAFPRDGRRPQLNEPLSFEVTQGKDGRKQATAVRRHAATGGDVSRQPHSRRAHEGARHSGHPVRGQHRAHGDSSALSPWTVAFVLVCAVMAAVYWQYDRRQQEARAAQAAALLEQTPLPRAAVATQPLAASPFRCDGRQHCSQMTSCAEAKYFLQNCPGPQMDGDGDGVPCEQQWCTHPGAR